MKLHLIRLLGASALLVSLGAWAQAPSSDFNEMLIDVVPFGEKINLNETVDISPDASPQGVERSTFGRAVAYEAQNGQRDFGEVVSGAVSANAGQPGFPNSKPPVASGQ
jgi:hypothetical protein